MPNNPSTSGISSASPALGESASNIGNGIPTPPEHPSIAKRRQTFSPPPKHNSLPPYVYKDYVTQSNKNVIFDIKCCPFMDDIFAATGGDIVTVYKAEKNGKMIPKAVFKDPNNDEYYAITWCMADAGTKLAVVFAGKRGAIRSCNAFTKAPIQTQVGHGESVNDLATDPTRPCLFASASADMTIRLWHVKQSVALAIFGGYAGEKDQILSVHIDRTGGYIASGCMDHAVRVWKIVDNDLVQKAIKAAPFKKTPRNKQPPPPVEVHYPAAETRDIHTNYVDSVKFVSNYILSKSNNSSMCLFKFGEFNDPAASGRGNAGKQETFAQILSKMEVPHTELWYIKLAVTHGPPLKAWIACGNHDGEIHLWNLHDKPIGTHSNYMLKHSMLPNLIRAVDFSRNGQHLFAAGSDGRIVRYDRRHLEGPESKPLGKPIKQEVNNGTEPTSKPNKEKNKKETESTSKSIKQEVHSETEPPPKLSRSAKKRALNKMNNLTINAEE